MARPVSLDHRAGTDDQSSPGVAGESCLYLYGITLNRSELSAALPAPLECVSTERLAAWVQRLTAEQCSPRVIDGILRNIEAAGPLARRHERVLELAMGYGSVLPARLYTLFSGAEALRVYLTQNEERLVSVLDQLNGRREWGIKLYFTEAGQGAALPVRVQQRELIDRTVRRVLGGLTPLAAQIRLKPCFPRQVSEQSQALVLNVSVLVDMSAEAVFNTEVMRLAGQKELDGFEFQLSGPWPAYSFCDDVLS